MKAAVCTRYGPPEVLQIRDVEKPRAPAKEIVVRVQAVAVTVTDIRMRTGAATAPAVLRTLMRAFLGFSRPRKSILGFVLAGVVDEVGHRVTRFKPGDHVYAFNGMRLGGFAEYTRVRTNHLVGLVPAGLTSAEAAAIPYGGVFALNFLRRVNIREGERVAIYGASGAVGTAAVQIAAAMGGRVTAVCSGKNAVLVRSLGAESVLDYTTQDSVGDERWDVVFDAAGKRKTSPLKDALKTALRPGGRYRSVDSLIAGFAPDSISYLSQLIEAGKLKPVIDCVYPLEQIADAHRYVDGQHKRGNVIVSITR